MSEGPKLAGLLAEQIEKDILESGHEPGTIVGSEPELIARYGVSRAVFREAIRILESHLVGQMRRGRGGGLLVTEPTPQAVSDVMRVYLQFRRVQDSELFEARIAVEAQCVELSMDDLSAEAREELLKHLVIESSSLSSKKDPYFDAAHNFHLLIARLAGNHPLFLFVHSLVNLTRHHPRRPVQLRRRTQTHEAHRTIADAMLQDDVDEARNEMARHLRVVATWWLQERDGHG